METILCKIKMRRGRNSLRSSCFLLVTRWISLNLKSWILNASRLKIMMRINLIEMKTRIIKHPHPWSLHPLLVQLILFLLNTHSYLQIIPTIIRPHLILPYLSRLIQRNPDLSSLFRTDPTFDCLILLLLLLLPIPSLLCPIPPLLRPILLLLRPFILLHHPILLILRPLLLILRPILILLRPILLLLHPTLLRLHPILLLLRPILLLLRSIQLLLRPILLLLRSILLLLRPILLRPILLLRPIRIPGENRTRITNNINGRVLHRILTLIQVHLSRLYTN